ncbi:hypothetical protein BO94DRAFT_320282 [Aspergillus sclerotioniger CBS 115572]|uniref:Uncharacterized protein n=1 Tax=Aspergillus sclerotioniger CBS 115572 TaxID=1450535 RepID=A0A317X6B4_9EURO|nr:hypothetical protein BO94DRAFT_320282 [Aspergillus sclerotioniger CBS 115572]PWY94123.1 hypothetical protein BO94DRAFT_320282 [Aspergillus sclerotioniger CBS 115572]
MTTLLHLSSPDLVKERLIYLRRILENTQGSSRVTCPHCAFAFGSACYINEWHAKAPLYVEPCVVHGVIRSKALFQPLAICRSWEAVLMTWSSTLLRLPKSEVGILVNFPSFRQRLSIGHAVCCSPEKSSPISRQSYDGPYRVAGSQLLIIILLGRFFPGTALKILTELSFWGHMSDPLLLQDAILLGTPT